MNSSHNPIGSIGSPSPPYLNFIYHSDQSIYIMPIPKDPQKAALWRKRQSDAKKGKSRNKGRSNPFFGQKHSPETLEVIRRASQGRKHSIETKKKMSLAHLGVSHPNKNKGKKWEEIVGIERATKLKEQRMKLNLGNNFHLGKKHTEETKKKISKITRQRTPRGADNPRWKGGVTARYIELRNSDGYRAWRKDVFERDNYTCQKCGDILGHNLNAHHIVPFANCVGICEELIYDVNNGITLCEECHKKEHSANMEVPHE